MLYLPGAKLIYFTIISNVVADYPEMHFDSIMPTCYTLCIQTKNLKLTT